MIRPLTSGEIAMARAVFGEAIDYGRVTIRRAKWWMFHPRDTIMAPDGHLWLHPRGSLWCADYAHRPLGDQAFFIHEMTHVWQHQRGLCLPLRRHPFCRYSYVLVPGRRLERYGIEQQAEIVRHAFLLRHGAVVRGAPALAQYESLLPFTPG